MLVFQILMGLSLIVLIELTILLFLMIQSIKKFLNEKKTPQPKETKNKTEEEPQEVEIM